jgi:hypothetical protein
MNSVINSCNRCTCNEPPLDTLVSVGTHLNFSYIQDSFFPFLFLFLLISGGILHKHMSVSMLYSYVTFLVIKPLGIKKRNSSSANKRNSATMKY